MERMFGRESRNWGNIQLALANMEALNLDLAKIATYGKSEIRYISMYKAKMFGINLQLNK